MFLTVRTFSSTFAVSFFLLSMPLAAVAQQSAEGLRMGPSAVAAATVNVTVPTSIQRGNVLDISANYPQLTVPLNANCIVLLPAPNPPYKETILFNRRYEALGVSGHGCPVYIPGFIQFAGTAIVIVTVEGAGIGVATVTVTP